MCACPRRPWNRPRAAPPPGINAPRPAARALCALILALLLMAGAALAAAYLPGWIRAVFGNERAATLAEQGYGSAFSLRDTQNGLDLRLLYAVADGNQVTALASLRRTADSPLPPLRQATVYANAYLRQNGAALPGWYGESSARYDEADQCLYVLFTVHFYQTADDQKMPAALPADAQLIFSVDELVFPALSVRVLADFSQNEALEALPPEQPLDTAGSAAQALILHSAQRAGDRYTVRYSLTQRNRDLAATYGEDEYLSFQTAKLTFLKRDAAGDFILIPYQNIPFYEGDAANATLSVPVSEADALALITAPTGAEARYAGAWTLAVSVR